MILIKINNLKNKVAISIFLALLFHVNGLLGMMTTYKPWFVSMTPFTLMLMFILLIWTEKKTSPLLYINAFVIFAIGMLVEIIGVNTAYLFGHYTYGNVMGIKWLGVPLLMGIQWWVTIVCSAHLLHFILSTRKQKLNTFYFSILAALITTGYDVLIEPIAMAFDYWQWTNNSVPLYNYVCWFLISFIIHFGCVTYNPIEKLNYYAATLIVTQALFFFLLNVLL